MNENLTTWNYNNSEVRTVTVNNEPWWVLADVCKVLELLNPTMVAKKLDEDEKAKFDLGLQGSASTVINESGLYSVILRSDKPQAKPFRKWVTSEVLPSIRKTGGYVSDDEMFINTYLPNADEATKVMFRTNLATIKNLNNKVGVLETENALQKQQIAELQPKGSYYDLVLNCKDLISTTEIAKDYGKSARWLNELLHELKVQFKQGNKIWILYQKYAEKGYTSTKTQTYNGNDGQVHTKVHTYWTQKGRLFIYHLLKSKGILPLIEQEDENDGKRI